MELSLSFGAVGDFIAVCNLIKTIISALDDARGSARDYANLIQDLNILSQTLLEVDNVFRNSPRVGGLHGLQALAIRTSGHIRDSLNEFGAKIKKYAPSLSCGGSGSRFRDAARKVQWKLEERDIDKFRAEILGHKTSLQILMDATSLSVSLLLT
jgi:hypothetical protein